MDKLKSIKLWADKHEWVMLLITLMIVLRLPTLFEPFWYLDENIYLAIGQALNQGQSLYVDIVDFPNKPPMMYWLAAVLKNVTTFRFVLLLWQILAVIVLHNLINKVFKNPTIAFFATLGYVYLSSSPILEGNIANAEIFFVVPTLIAMWLLVPKITNQKSKSITRKQAFIAGLLFGLGLLFKIHVSLDLLALVLFFVFTQSKPNLLKSGLNIFGGLLLGVSVPLVLAAGLLYLQGTNLIHVISLFFADRVYVSSWGQNHILAQTLGMGSLWARTFVLLIILICLWLKRKIFDKTTLFAVIWLVTSLYAALLSARPYGHYLLQTIPPLVLTISLLFQTRARANYIISITTLVVFSLAFIRFEFEFSPVRSYYRDFISYQTNQIDQNEYFRRFDQRMPRNYAVARQITALTDPNEQIYVWGNNPEIYPMANRLQIGKTITSFHTLDLDYFETTLNLINANPPEVIVWYEDEPIKFEALESYLKRNYVLFGTIGDPDFPENGLGNALIYKRSRFL